MREKHHYIPVFYLKRWTGSDGRLCVYCRPYVRVKANRKHPDATGYEYDLYVIEGAGAETAGHLEGRFLRRLTTTPLGPSTISRLGALRSWMSACEVRGRGS